MGAPVLFAALVVGRSFLCHNGVGREECMSERSSIGVRPEHIRYAVGYACTNAWGIMKLYVPLTGSLAL